ncbi:MAG: hypothetical protein NZM65_08810 [Flavobacteriales bacterium]|nr:hypothetical protein [Flavobacteriales bacterium]MDW8410772.1 hypothetical protein [Flavobacteriales bacterium]
MNPKLLAAQHPRAGGNCRPSNTEAGPPAAGLRRARPEKIVSNYSSQAP